MRRLWPLVLVAFVIVEIVVIVEVAEWIGPWPTVLLLIVGCGVGGWVLKSAGVRAWRAMRGGVTLEGVETTVVDGRTGVAAPGQRAVLADSGVIAAGGVLLMIPGFVSDVLALFCLVPFTRPLVRRVAGLLAARGVVRVATAGYADRRDGAYRIYRDQPPGPPET